MNMTNFRELPIGKENMDLDLPRQGASANLHYSSNDVMNYNEPGFKIDLFTKYFDLISSYSNVYHYQVKIKASFSHKKCIGTSVGRTFARNNEAKRKQVIAELLELKKGEKFRYLFDGRKNLLTSIELPVARKSIFSIKLKTGEMYRVTLQPTKKYYGTNAISVSLLQSMTWHSDFSERNDLLQLNKALEKTYNSEIRFDRYYSVFSVDKIDIGKGLEIWRGYEGSMNLTQAGPAYVLNVTELVFHRAGPVIDYTSELLGVDVTQIRRRLTADELKEIKNALSGVRVYSTHLSYRRRHTIEDISNAPATDVLISTADTVMSVAEYFEAKYRRLLFPNLPCLKMESSNSQVYIPLENCFVCEGQQKLDYYKADPEKELNPAGDFASFSKNEESDTSKKMSLFMDLNWENTECRRANRPVSQCLEGSKVFYDTRKWSIQRKLSNNSWIVISFVDEIQLPISKITEFVDCLNAVCFTLGLSFGRFLGIRIIQKNEIVDNVFQKEEIKNATLVVILLSKKSLNNYDEVKFTAEYILGLTTKCVLDDTIRILTRRIATNICLSIDAKMGGISFGLRQAPKIFSQPTLVLGAVTTQLENNILSSVVGSLDAYPARYQVSCRVQQEKKSSKMPRDFITDLKNMAKTILNAFYHHTKGKYPEKIIIFRYSSIISNFQLLKYHEIRALQELCKDVVGCILPITFIVASKQNPKSLQSVSQSKSGATSSNIFHYILNNNATDKPTYYYVIHDDNKFTAEELQQLTDHMCYVCIFNKYMPLPTPIRYAFRAAMHAKKYACYQCTKNKVDVADLPDFVIDAINKMEWNDNSTFFQ